MSQTLRQKLRNQWITIVVLVVGALLLRALDLEIPSGILLIVATLTFVFGVLKAYTRSISGMETGEEAAARAAERDRSPDRFAAMEQDMLQASDVKAKSSAQGQLQLLYFDEYHKSSASIPNGPRPVEIEDGDFGLLAKRRHLMEAMRSTTPKQDKSLAKDIRNIDESVEKWRRAVEEVRAGTRQVPDHFSAEDYLRRLDEAFPKRQAPQS